MEKSELHSKKLNNKIVCNLKKIDISLDQSWCWQEYKESIVNKVFYNEDLIREFEKRFIVASRYLIGELITKLSKENKLTTWSIQRFAEDLLNDKPAFQIIKMQIGYKGDFGLSVAQYEMRKFKYDNHRLPTSKDKMSNAITRAIQRGEWELREINTWNDILYKTFGTINRKSNIYIGYEGLKKAKKELRDFKKEIKRLPTSKDNEISGIRQALKRGEWKQFGYTSWNILLRETFGLVNLEYGKYEGKKGLEKAIEELLEFEREKKRLPVRRDKELWSVMSALDNGNWVKMGINTWNDILYKTFGRVNKETRV